jgi:hypothetical protein
MDSVNGLGEWTRRMVSVNGSCAQINTREHLRNTRETPVKHPWNTRETPVKHLCDDLCDDLCERQWTYYRKREMSEVLRNEWRIGKLGVRVLREGIAWMVCVRDLCEGFVWGYCVRGLCEGIVWGTCVRGLIQGLGEWFMRGTYVSEWFGQGYCVRGLGERSRWEGVHRMYGSCTREAPVDKWCNW